MAIIILTLFILHAVYELSINLIIYHCKQILCNRIVIFNISVIIYSKNFLKNVIFKIIYYPYVRKIK